MQIQVVLCVRSIAVGLLLGFFFTGSAWYGTTLAGRAQITQAMLAQAKCDPVGFVAITFADESQFTCAPARDMPPTSRAEAERRSRKAGG